MRKIGEQFQSFEDHAQRMRYTLHMMFQRLAKMETSERTMVRAAAEATHETIIPKYQHEVEMAQGAIRARENQYSIDEAAERIKEADDEKKEQLMTMELETQESEIP